MEVAEIEAFLRIVSDGGFTRAAQALHISQPAISRRIELLERELGAPLFERLREGARLTEAGRAFLPYARQALAALRDGAAAVRAVDREEAGEIVVALVGSLASTSLTARLWRFREDHPAIRLRLRTARSAEVSELVVSGEATFGVRYFGDPDPGVVALPAYEEMLAVVCSPRHPLARELHPSVQSLAGMPWVGFPRGPRSSGDAFVQTQARLLAANGLADAEVLAVDSLTAQKRLVEADFGLGLLPESAVEEEMRLGTLHRLEIAELRASIPVTVIYRAAGYLSSAARSLRDMLAAGQ